MSIIPILCVLLAVSEFTMQTRSHLVFIVWLALDIYLINKWYLSTLAKLLHMDLNLASMNEEDKRVFRRLDATTSEVSLACMTREFETAIQNAKEILSKDGLRLQLKVIQIVPASYLARLLVKMRDCMS